MVRETRHVWVGNLPADVREEDILNHFKRYGRVESVKILPKRGTGVGVAAFVDFVDMRSAQKAHNAVNKLGGRDLWTKYKVPRDLQEPTTSHSREVSGFRGGSGGPPYSPLQSRTREGRNIQRRNRASETLERPYGPPERGTAGLERTRRYDRGYYGNPRDRTLEHGLYYNSRRSPSRFDDYDLLYDLLYDPLYDPLCDPLFDSLYEPLYESRSREPFALPSAARRDRYRSDITREIRRRRPDRSYRRSQDRSYRRNPDRNHRRSRSRSPHSKNRSPQKTAGQESKPDQSPSGNGARSRSSSRDSTHSKNSQDSGSDSSDGCAAVPASPSQPRKSFGVKIENLPVRCSDSSLKDGLFYAFKKYGKVTSVQIHGKAEERCGLVFFRKQVDQKEALKASKGKLFLGMQIEVTDWDGPEDDSNSQPLDDEIDDEIDEFHPKANRTLFIGNLEHATTTDELQKVFQEFGEIVDINIKMVSGVPTYAFVEYFDISSVCKAIKKMDRKYLGKNRLKLGFGKCMPTNCLWIDGLHSGVTEKYLKRYFSRYGPVKVVYDPAKGRALVSYKEIEFAQEAVKETKRRKTIGGNVVKLDFANEASQAAYCSSMEASEQIAQEDGDAASETGSDAESDACAAVPAPSDGDSPRKGFGIKVETLPENRRVSGLQVALFKEYKKFGELVAVQIRHAQGALFGLVFFRHKKDQQEALKASKEKVFLGSNVNVTAWEGTEIDPEFDLTPLDKTINVFHPKASRTLHIGNLEETITSPELQHVFQQFGEIVDIDIKKVDGQPTYALLQYCDIPSACKAIRLMHGEYLGKKPLKVGFGDPVPTSCVWVDGLPMCVCDKYLMHHFNQYGPVLKVVHDRYKGTALVHYEKTEFAEAAVKDTKRRRIAGNFVKLDFANEASQAAFSRSMEAPEPAAQEDGDAASETGSDAESDSSEECAAVPAPPSQPLSEADKGFAVKVESLAMRRKVIAFQSALRKEFKKFGQVVAVQVRGVPKKRYGLVFFKRQQDQQKALKAKGNAVLGWQMKVTKWEGTESETNWTLAKEKIDEFHPKANRTLFVGNLEETTTRRHLYNAFQQFGEILDIEVKTVQGALQYAFVQYFDISSVCEAIRKMHGEYLGKKRLKVGFGRSVPTRCVWIGGLPMYVSNEPIMEHFKQYGSVEKVLYDSSKGRALVIYSETKFAQEAVFKTKRGKFSGLKVKVDFANQVSQLAFCGSMGLSMEEICDVVESR